MKIALAADIHFGIHTNSEAYAESINTAFHAMLERMVDENANRIIFLGDMFDTRLAINQAAEDLARKCLEDMERQFIEIAILPGNHDCYYSNTNRINSVNKFGRLAKIVNAPTVLFGSVLAVPWMCEENMAECAEAIRNAEVPYCAGHFDVSGARMNNFKLSEEGIGLSMFKKFDKVFSGHFHSRQTLGNVEYIGSLVQTSFTDEGEKRGFAILDSESGETEYFDLPSMKHFRIALTEDFSVESHDAKGNAIELLVPDKLWDDERLVRNAEKALMEAGVNYFAGSKRDMAEAEEIATSMPSMKRDESVMEYIEKYLAETNPGGKEVLDSLKRLHQAVARA